MTVQHYAEFAKRYWKQTGRLPHKDGLNFGLIDSKRILMDAFAMPPKEAITFLQSKGLQVTDKSGEIEASANSKAFTVAGIMALDTLKSVQDSLAGAMEKGQSFAEWKKEIADKVALPASRLQTIFRTNLQTSYMAGRYKQQMETAPLRPYLQYVAIEDSVTTKVCHSLSGKVLRADDPFWSVYYPPNHYNCRASVKSLSARQVKDRKLIVEDGKSLKAPFPDGFDTAPGAEWKPQLDKYPKALQEAFLKRSAEVK